jgi:glycosyltransferase involved in cell wall biosynthesis
MNLLKKAVLFYRQEGLLNTLHRTIEKCWDGMKQIPIIGVEKISKRRYIQQLAQHTAGKRVFVLIPCIDWNIPLYQRPHQIAVELTKDTDSVVLFISDQYRYDNFSGYTKIQNRLFLFSHRLVSYLNEVLGDASEVIVMMSWMRQAHLLTQFSYQKLIYEYIDDMSLFYYHTPQLEQEHYRLMKEADLTVCTARALYEKALPYARKAILSPNAGDYEFFHSRRNAPVNEQLKGLLDSADCVIGYYGCLAKWFDYELMLEVARRKPSWFFVLIGYCFDGTADRFKKAGLSNIIHIPAQPYQALPSFVRAFDIQCIPFLINDITLSTSPVKLFEYMASGKPILTSKMPECLNYRSVVTYDGIDDFIARVENLLSLKNDEDFLAEMDKEARENTWEARVKTILDNIA